MYTIKNYLLSMQSHWMVNQPLYTAVQDSLPAIARFRTKNGTEDLEKLPIHQHVKKVFPDVYRAPLLRRTYCKMLMEEVREMQKLGMFETNPNEDRLRQISDIFLRLPERLRRDLIDTTGKLQRQRQEAGRLASRRIERHECGGAAQHGRL